MMENDVIHGNLDLLDHSISQLEALCMGRQVENNNEVERIINRLTTESWSGSSDSEAFKKKFSEYQTNLAHMASFYEQIISDLKVIRRELEEQMQKRPNIHTDGF